MPTYEPKVISHPAGNTRPYLDEHLIYSLPVERQLDLNRYHTFRAHNSEMNQIYSIEHYLIGVEPKKALAHLNQQIYLGLSKEQVSRLSAYIKKTINRLSGYDRVQNYYFLHATPEDKLLNRPQMSRNGVAFNGSIVRGYRREDLIRGGLLT